MRKAFAAVLLFSLTFTGCRSAFVSATITNNSAAPVTLIEVDYPSASFGVGALAPGAQFHYRFKIQGGGPIKLQFTDASGKAHTASGPDLQQGEQGTLQMNIESSGNISWIPNLTQIR
ncbi:hypothetical protein H7849_07400 [Alloacidobacterium dinghuense]|uniref:Lipoprotein n=1 Tax=Alloacidobacterium dinghuense TaxID=2763107 RepID=A0A7G8BMG7_9BACT|nr:hypothetical protein [Alloacidobacterium dinghuense]QNI33737.1 hypothetical protein H7849_07400 [Alloacidobacterium dinghuense]